MSKFILSAEALNDLDLIREHIALDNPDAADRVIEAAYRHCAMLGDHPELGRMRHLAGTGLAGMRSFVITEFPNYVIFYRVLSRALESGVHIVRVLHGARNIDGIFDHLAGS